MKNPYEILGISPSASDDEVKAAYKKLVKKYHPDNYSQSPLGEIADEKMQEINNAFDEIMNMRRGSSNAGEQTTGGKNMDYYRVRSLIQSGDVTQADGILNSVPQNQKDAEWFFLKGSVCYTRGWLNEAYDNFATAVNLNPDNQEYRAALEQMNRNRGGYMNGNPQPQYNTNPNVGGCNGCDMCQGLICADCCCECMGGDLISCC
ncbi:MAG: J domain-containing protein [Oscillospiraceae bacterium]|nr:J domain-containing protein [Oscillospiraceae bacterium]MBQ8883972.1 J domain-containing protein [Oscillospiraceae bacterium]